jgi:hypothetical protein
MQIKTRTFRSLKTILIMSLVMILTTAVAIAEFISVSSTASSTGPSHPLAEDLEPWEMVILEMGCGKRNKIQIKRYIEQI